MMDVGILSLPNELQEKPALWKKLHCFFEMSLLSFTRNERNTFLNGAFVFYILNAFLDYCV